MSKELDELQKQKDAFDKIFIDVGSTTEGQIMYQALADRILNRTIYRAGNTLEDVAYRQGQHDLVKQMLECLPTA